MAKADFSLDESGMNEYLNSLIELKGMLIDISDSIDSIHSDLLNEDCIKWHGNGKEQLTAYLALVDRYASLVSGEPKNVFEIIKSAFWDDLHAEGTEWRHVKMMEQSIETFLEKASRFSFLVSDKAGSINKLDSLNFKE